METRAQPIQVNGRPRVILITNRLSPVVAALAAAAHVHFVGLVEIRAGNPGLNHFCQRQNIPHYRSESFDRELRQWIRSKQPDIIALFSLHRLVPTDVCRMPRLSTINLHPGRLPEQRGANPLWEQYRNNKPEGAMTVHLADEHFDTGDILLECSFTHPPGGDYEAFSDTVIARWGAPLLLQAISHLQDIIPRKQVSA